MKRCEKRELRKACKRRKRHMARNLLLVALGFALGYWLKGRDRETV